MINSDFVHIPVMWREVLEFVGNSSFSGKGTLVDATLGEGGHSEIILNRFDSIEVIGLDADREILGIAEKRLKMFGGRFKSYNCNFSEMSSFLGDDSEINYFLFDFGISSYHFEESERGFAFSKDQVLDMRLNKSLEIDARYVVNRYSEKDLVDIFSRYGEERYSRRIASAICKSRKMSEIKTTGQLAQVVLNVVPGKFSSKRIHPATRVFQAVRIEVNGELDAIEKCIDEALPYLLPRGRIMTIAFHSLEDRIVKNKFKRLEKGCTCAAENIHCVCSSGPIVKVLTKKPMVPLDDEVKINRRSRSSKLRACEKL